MFFEASIAGSCRSSASAKRPPLGKMAAAAFWLKRRTRQSPDRMIGTGCGAASDDVDATGSSASASAVAASTTTGASASSKFSSSPRNAPGIDCVIGAVVASTASLSRFAAHSRARSSSRTSARSSAFFCASMSLGSAWT